MNMKSSLLIGATMAAGLILAACSKSEDAAAASPAASAPAAAASTAQASAPAEGRAIELTANDSMKFSETEIHAKAGETISVTLTNIGTMPKFSMGHNFVVLHKGVDEEAFLNDAMGAAASDYIPESHAKDIIAHTKLLGPKEVDTITFKVPSEAGDYPFLCSFPGHFQVGMKGNLIVE